MPGLFPVFFIPQKISQFKETCMLIMDYQSIIGKEIPDYAKNSTWNLLHAYIDESIQRLIYEYPKYGV